MVVICFQISIFEPLETTAIFGQMQPKTLWFAFKLVSLNHWKQPILYNKMISNKLKRKLEKKKSLFPAQNLALMRDLVLLQ